MKTKKMDIYQAKKSGSYMLCPTNDRLKQKDSRKFGKAVGKNISDEALGKMVKDMFINRCD